MFSDSRNIITHKVSIQYLSSSNIPNYLKEWGILSAHYKHDIAHLHIEVIHDPFPLTLAMITPLFQKILIPFIQKTRKSIFILKDLDCFSPQNNIVNGAVINFSYEKNFLCVLAIWRYKTSIPSLPHLLTALCSIFEKQVAKID